MLIDRSSIRTEICREFCKESDKFCKTYLLGTAFHSRNEKPLTSYNSQAYSVIKFQTFPIEGKEDDNRKKQSHRKQPPNFCFLRGIPSKDLSKTPEIMSVDHGFEDLQTMNWKIRYYKASFPSGKSGIKSPRSGRNLAFFARPRAIALGSKPPSVTRQHIKAWGRS